VTRTEFMKEVTRIRLALLNMRGVVSKRDSDADTQVKRRKSVLNTAHVDVQEAYHIRKAAQEAYRDACNRIAESVDKEFAPAFDKVRAREQQTLRTAASLPTGATQMAETADTVFRHNVCVMWAEVETLESDHDAEIGG